MKTITLYVGTNRVGSRVETSFQVEAEDLEDLSDSDLNNWMLETLLDSGLIEWGYEIE